MKERIGGAFRRLQGSTYLPAIVLPVIILAYLLLVLSLHPTNIFGLSQDDTLYFSSARALAEGKGYILPSVPGSPAATKYPILYSWLLSWIWRINPAFPENLSLAVGMNLTFGLFAILLMYLFLRVPLRVARIESLLLTAFCALHPAMILYSTSLMTEVPFFALCTAALLCAHLALESRLRLRWVVLAALFTNLAVFMRLAGIALIAGMVAAPLLRRWWKAVWMFVAGSVPGLAYFAYQTWFHPAAKPPVLFSAQFPGWKQTWFYYTSYTAFRHLDSPDVHSMGILLLNQFLYFISSIAGYFVTPLTDASIALWFVCCLVIGALLAIAIARQFRDFSPPVEVVAFVAYSALLVGWDYAEWTRFLLPFFPLVLVLTCREIHNCFASLRASCGVDFLSRALLGCFLFCLGALGAATLWNYAGPARAWLPQMSFERATQRPEKLEAYAWIHDHSLPEDRIIAAEDGLAYFYTGRQFMNFTVLMPFDVYDQAGLQRDIEHMPDVAIALHAHYWLITDQDSQTQLRMFRDPLKDRLALWETVLPRVFRSSTGMARVYDLSCLADPQFGDCPPGVRALLPGTERTNPASDGPQSFPPRVSGR